MDKIIDLIKNLNDISDSAEIFPRRPDFTYGFSLDTDGRYSVISLGHIDLVDGQEFPQATATEIIAVAYEGLKKHLDALLHAETVLIFLNQNIVAAQMANAAKREMAQ